MGLSNELQLVSSVGEIIEHQVYPIAEQVIHKIINELGASPIFKNNIHVNFDHTAVSSTSDDNHNAKINPNMFVGVATPTLNPNNVKWPVANSDTFVGQGYRLNNIHKRYVVFQDLNSSMNLTEHVVPCSISIECTMSFKDRPIAYEIASRLYNTYRNGDMIAPVDFIHDYPLPRDIYTVIYLGYKLLNLNNNPYTFLEYLRDKSNNRISINTNRNTDRNDVELIVQFNNASCIMEIEYNADKPEALKRNQSTHTYNVTFNVIVQYSRVDLVYLTYPIVINNTVIPSSAIPVDTKSLYPTQEDIHPVIDMNNYYNYLKQQDLYRSALQFPRHDKWKIPTNSPIRRMGYTPFYIIIILLDLNLDFTTIDLTGDLGEGLYLLQELLDKLRAYGRSALWPFNEYWISLFANNTLIEQNILTLTDGTLLTIPNRDPYKVYRLVISYRGESDGSINFNRFFRYDINTHTK